MLVVHDVALLAVLLARQLLLLHLCRREARRVGEDGLGDALVAMQAALRDARRRLLRRILN